MATKSRNKSFYDHILREYPADEFRWSKTSILNLQQAVFLSYGIEPGDNDKNVFLLLHFDQFLEEVDEFSIFELSRNAVIAHELPLHDRDHVKAEDFITWADGLGIPIKKEFFYRSSAKKNEAQIYEKQERRPTVETMRKELSQIAAAAHWYKQEKEGKAYTGPTDLARNKDMIALIDHFNQLSGAKPIKGEEHRSTGVDPEWFSERYPGDTKPGPRRKK